MVITDSLKSEVTEYLRSTLDGKRYLHSVSAAETSEKLCLRFGLPRDKGYFAGLIHDCTRDLPRERMTEMALRDGRGMSHEETLNPILLHGRAGVFLAMDVFGINDPEVLEAVRLHTTGDAGMCDLARIVLIADYIEPRREYITAEYLKTLDGKTIDGMLLAVIYSTLEYLAASSKQVSEKTIQLIRELENER